MDGALDKIAKAKGHMARREILEKGNFISWAISIIGGLRASLDFERGGEIAANLEMLYDYMERRLVLANADNNIDALDEIARLLSIVKDAWVKIGDSPEANKELQTAAQSTVESTNRNIVDSV
jgi:flagellar protein FliS